ncbi:hypothetical protein AZE42_10486 [Rhizopogon vesiculosus]|uniref:Condensation domain-containing protein n=1 Tax=Rhizopogon vesiculosus TaxID=180088 RepID=A0A1J8Q0T3_9AGAM|nr:hypothetical protein AZE42_10486 [Rhizopogon vesiculosus]
MTWTVSELERKDNRRVFSRPLGLTETGFALDARFNGTADCVLHLQLRSLNKHDENILSDSNIIRTWLSLKRRYPMLCAQIRSREGVEKFFVEEKRVASLNHGEVTFGSVSSTAEARQVPLDMLNGPRPLSDELLSCIYILRPTDDPSTLHVYIVLAHCITDGASNTSIQRCFLDALSSKNEAPVASLEERLSMVIPLECRKKTWKISPAKRRWMQAIGYAIYLVKMNKIKGGQTIPCRLTTTTLRSPAKSCMFLTSFTPEQSAIIVGNCRRNKITFGNALLALTQVAMTRILYRRFIRGDISASEWEYRQKQPMNTGGPLNLRPYLDEDWAAKGGAGEVFIAISFFCYQLPFMTLGITRNQDPATLRLINGAPSFADLLTFSGFLHRANLIKTQARKFFKHPLFEEIAMAGHIGRAERSRLAAMEWMHRQGGSEADPGTAVNVFHNSDRILAHGGSSMGDLDAVVPLEYPLPSTNPLSPRSNQSHPVKAGYIVPPAPDPSDDKVKIVLESSGGYLHCRPNELYLGATTSRKQLHLSVFYDGNVYQESVVQEWVEEVKDAALWYLGQSHSNEGRVEAKL